MTAIRKAEISRGASIVWSADTMVEHLNRAVPPVGDVSSAGFAVVQRPADPADEGASASGSVVEVVTARYDTEAGIGKLVHLRPDPESPTGYALHEADLPTVRWSDGAAVPVERVARTDAFYQTHRTQDGRIVPAINAVVQFPRADDPGYLFVLPMQFTEETGWAPWKLNRERERPVRNHLDRVRQAAVYRDGDGRHILHGLSAVPGRGEDAERMFFIHQAEDGEWRENNAKRRADRAPEVRLLPGRGGGDRPDPDP